MTKKTTPPPEAGPTEAPEAATPSVVQPPIKSREQLEKEAGDARKKAVDAENARLEAEERAKQDALANTPLTAEERMFMEDIGKRMNNARRITMPASADILRYSQLKARAKVK